MPTLHGKITTLAQSFALTIAQEVARATVRDLVALSAAAPVNGPRGGFSPRLAVSEPVVAPVPAPVLWRPSRGALPRAKLARRSDTEIAKIASALTSLVAKHPKGLRAESLRLESGLSKPELQSPLAYALRTKADRKRGEKRTTVYFVAKAPGAKARKGAR